MTVRTRFAPSPTGSLHVGGARTALFCLLYARRHGGKFVLRIEDTDRARSTDESIRGILRDLEWLGLTWDEGPNRPEAPYGPYFQSERLDVYQRYFDQLVESGHAYEAWESREELGALRAAAPNKVLKYRRIDYSTADLERFRSEERVPVLRLMAPTHDIVIHDAILGDVTIGSGDMDDIVIRKADGFPTYHFAVVVDDHHMHITQVLRGQEHLMNTAKHVGIYEAIGWEPAPTGHMPLIFNPTGTKMSKRDKAKAARLGAREIGRAAGHPASDWTWLSHATGRDAEDIRQFMKKKHDGVGTATDIAEALNIELPMIEVMDFKRGGYLPEALINYLSLLGWNPGVQTDEDGEIEILTVDEMVPLFSLDRVNRTAARFDPAKLKWMNGEYIRKSSIPRLEAALDDWLQLHPTSRLAGARPQLRRALLQLFHQRITTLSELEASSAYFFETPTSWNEKAVKKHLLKGNGLDNLAAVTMAISQSEWTVEGLESTVQSFADGQDLPLGKFAQPLRIAATGGPVSPPIFDTLALLGRDECLARIERCLAAHR